KAAAGIRRGGRPTTKPVRHDILSWDEDERPSSEEMARTARSYLAALGLAQQEAVIVGHDHNGKRHVHIVANTVNPMTGRVADMTGDQWKAQAWCLAYELAQGRVRCKHRMAPRIARAFSTATGRPKSGQRRSRPEWEREQKRKSADREARVRHKADAWAKLIDDIKASAANVRHSVDKQKADTQPAPRP
ncbi:MAG: relaxase/mobilization nuclease domain-containing protein, partial [Hyphomicrobiaceae bacterium]